MSGFQNAVVGGGGALVRVLIKSVNFVAGSSGWQITKAGDAEFNSLTLHSGLTVPDAADIPAELSAYFGTDLLSVVLYNFIVGAPEYQFTAILRGTVRQRVEGVVNKNNANVVRVLATYSYITAGTATLVLGDEAASPVTSVALGTAMKVETTQGGSIIDDRGATYRPFHVVAYSGTTDASGFLTVNHGCPFTPTSAMFSQAAGGSSFGVPWGYDNLGTVSIRLRFHNANGTGGLATSAVSGYIWLTG